MFHFFTIINNLPFYMKSIILERTTGKSLSLISFLIFFMNGFYAMAQAPTSFTYPTPVVYIANVSNVFLSPNVAGGVTTYSMPASPALPAGLTFYPNTGIISGVPTVALSSTNYTITATNSSGSATTTINMIVTSNYLNNNNKQLHFGGSGVTVTHPNGTSSGTTAGDVTVFHNIRTITSADDPTLTSSQSIDCIVVTKAVNNVTSWYAYDQNATSGDYFDSNSADFFSPQVNFGDGGGSVSFDFQFILAGSYNSTTKKGINIVLQKVKLNTYDIDGNDSDGSYQFNEFGGFSTSELGPTPKVAAQYNATTGLTKFVSTSISNSSTITAAATRVRVTYENMSSFSIVVGAGASGRAYFFLDFNAGTDFSNKVTSSPSVDLNTSDTGIGKGVGNEASGCGDVVSGITLPFTIPSETNIATDPTDANLKELDVSFLSTDILNGTNEKLVVNGTDYILNAASGSMADITVSSVLFKVTKTITGNIHKIAFTKSGGGNFTLAQAEALLDVLKYKNDASIRIAGERSFTVNVLNSTFKSPDAVFKATINCVSISGHIWRDANGLLGTSDFNTISANSPVTGQLAAGAAYAILVNPADNKVLDSKAIEGGGAFAFGNVSQGSYIVYVSDAAKTIGSTFTAAIPPAGGYVFVGENLGAGAGSDLSVDGKLLVTVGSTAITDANFGIDIPPVADPKTYIVAASAFSTTPPSGYPNINNGSIQYLTIATASSDLPNGTLSGSDAEDCATSGSCNSNKTFQIGTINGNTRLYYDFSGTVTEVTNGTKINNYDNSKLIVYGLSGSGMGGSSFGFTYSLVDAAGVKSEPVLYSIASLGPLPVTLAKFEVSKEAETTLLTWFTTAETNSERFDIQHSTDAKTWQILGTVAAQGDTQLRQNYSFTHASPATGNNYYRLKMVDRDGTFAYSTIRNLEFGQTVVTKLFPNPVSDRLIIEDADWASVKDIAIYNVSGAILYQNSGSNIKNEIDVQSMRAGNYILKLSRKNGSVFTSKISIVK
jgi:hypothetical protein